MSIEIKPKRKTLRDGEVITVRAQEKWVHPIGGGAMPFWQV